MIGADGEIFDILVAIIEGGSSEESAGNFLWMDPGVYRESLLPQLDILDKRRKPMNRD